MFQEPILGIRFLPHATNKNNGAVSDETALQNANNMKKLLLIVMSCAIMVGCKNTVDVNKEYMALGEVKKVNSLQLLLTLNKDNMTMVETPDYYIENFVIFDSLMFIDTNQDSGLLDILSMDSMKSYGRFLNKGKANGEFLYGINLTLHSSFECIMDTVYVNMYDPVSARLFSLNLSKSIMENTLSLKELNFNRKLPNSAFWAKTIGDTLLIVRDIDEMETHQNRTILSCNGPRTNTMIEELNGFEIPLNEDFNIMSSLVATSPINEYVVEAMIGMNYINVYSLNGEMGYTICVGEELDKLSDILSTSRFARKYMFADLRAYSFGFAVLKFDITERVYQSDEHYTPSILLFDWIGNPIGEIKSDIKFNHFDYDEQRKMLYILDSDNKLMRCKLELRKFTKL